MCRISKSRIVIRENSRIAENYLLFETMLRRVCNVFSSKSICVSWKNTTGQIHSVKKADKRDRRFPFR